MGRAARRAAALALLPWAASELLRACPERSTAGWVTFVSPSNSVLSAAPWAIDNNDLTALYFNAVFRDVNLTIDAGAVNTHHLWMKPVFTGETWVDAFSIFTSVDGASYTHYQTATGWQILLDGGARMVTQRSWRYIRVALLGGRDTSNPVHWGITDLTLSNCNGEEATTVAPPPGAAPAAGATTQRAAVPSPGPTTAATSSAASASFPAAAATTTVAAAANAATTLQPVSLALDRLGAQENLLLQHLLLSEDATASFEGEGATTVAVRLSPATGPATVKVAGTAASVRLPASLSSSTAGDVLTVSVLAEPLPADVDPLVDQVIGVVNVNLFDDTGSRKRVGGLVGDPILVALPVGNQSEQLTCVYWDVSEGRWLQDGVETRSTADGALLCASSHLTMFGAFGESIERTLKCTQLNLLSVEAAREFIYSDWHYQWQGFIFYGLVSAVLAMVLVALYLDHRRKKDPSYWSDEYFLVPIDVEHPHPPESACSCCQSQAMRDAVDDIFSRWFTYFSELRDFLEGMLSGLHLHPGEDMAQRIRKWGAEILDVLMLNVTRSHCCLDLRLAEADVVFVTENKAFRVGLEQAVVTKLVAAQSPASNRIRAWIDLHDEVVDHVITAWHDDRPTGWRPIWRLFYVKNPFVAAFVDSRLSTCSSRVLLFTAELLGSILMVTLFFQASGTVRNKRNRGGCLQVKSVWDVMARLVVIALASVLVAGLPVSILTSLHGRRMKKFPYEGCPEWKRQLRSWHLQDCLFMTIGISYVAFCTCFIGLFLANIAPLETPPWGISLSISVAEDIIAIPLSVATCLPLMIRGMLNLLTRLLNLSRVDLLQSRLDQLVQSNSFWSKLVVSV